MNWMRATVVGLVTPHLLRVVDIANQAEKGVNVDWHLRDAVTKSMRELGDQFNAAALVGAYIEGLEAAVENAPKARTLYIGALQAAATTARSLRRD